jgi:hypothetical protein
MDLDSYFVAWIHDPRLSIADDFFRVVLGDRIYR